MDKGAATKAQGRREGSGGGRGGRGTVVGTNRRGGFFSNHRGVSEEVECVPVGGEWATRRVRQLGHLNKGMGIEMEKGDKWNDEQWRQHVSVWAQDGGRSRRPEMRWAEVEWGLVNGILDGSVSTANNEVTCYQHQHGLVS